MSRRNTYYVWDNDRAVADKWGYAHHWRTHLKAAEKLGYHYSNAYGFHVNTSEKTYSLDEALCKKVEAGKYATPIDCRDYRELKKAERFLLGHGYRKEVAA